MNKEVLAEDEKRGISVAVAGEGGKSKWQKKSTASKFPRVNPLGVTVVVGSSSSAEGVNPPGPASALVTVASDVPTAVPVLTRPRGVAVLVAESRDENTYTEGEDPEIEALFDESTDLFPLAEENIPREGTAQPGIPLLCFYLPMYCFQ